MLWPEDAFELFDFKETLISGTGASQSLCLQDPTRVVLAFGASVNVAVTTRSPAVVNQGLLVTGGVGSLILTAALHGPFPALQWFAIPAAGNTINVFEAILKRHLTSAQRQLARQVANGMAARRQS